MLQHHMHLLITAAPRDEQSMFVPAITHVYLYVSEKQQTANWDGYAKFARIKNESLSLVEGLLCICAVQCG